MATDITVTEDVTKVTVTESTTAIDISPQVTSVGVSAVDITAANIASSISLTPTGNIAASNVQAAFAETGANKDFTTALKDNSSCYRIDGRKTNFKEVGKFLRTKGIDLDHNRFLILQGEVEQISQMKPKGERIL